MLDVRGDHPQVASAAVGTITGFISPLLSAMGKSVLGKSFSVLTGGMDLFSHLSNALSGCGDWISLIIDPFLEQWWYDRVFVMTRDAAINAFEEWVPRYAAALGKKARAYVENGLFIARLLCMNF